MLNSSLAPFEHVRPTREMNSPDPENASSQ